MKTFAPRRQTELQQLSFDVKSQTAWNLAQMKYSKNMNPKSSPTLTIIKPFNI